MNNEEKLTIAEEYHTMAAKAVRRENEELLNNYIKKIEYMSLQLNKQQEEFQLAKAEERLRDNFAMSALSGFVTKCDDLKVDVIAKECYKIADEMIKVKKGQANG